MTLRSLSRFYELIVTQSLKSSKKILRDQLFDCFLFTQRYFGITTTLICLFYFFSVTSLMRDKSFYLRLIDNRMLRHTKVLKLKLFWCFFGKKKLFAFRITKNRTNHENKRRMNETSIQKTLETLPQLRMLFVRTKHIVNTNTARAWMSDSGRGISREAQKEKKQNITRSFVRLAF